MTKAESLRKQAEDLRVKIRKLEADAKRADEEVFVRLGAEAVKFIKGEISIDDLKLKAIEFGAIEAGAI